MRTVQAEGESTEPGTRPSLVEHEEHEEYEEQVTRTSETHVLEMRRKLLDLRTSNRLLDFSHAERGRNYVRVVDEVPELLHRRLEEGRKLRILPLPASLAELEPPGDDAPGASEPESAEAPEPTEVVTSDELVLDLDESDGEASEGLRAAQRAARLLGIDPSLELPPPTDKPPRRHRDDALQTLLYPELHQKILANIADVTRSAREEQGIHTLFAAFGFVEWYERPDAEVPRFAPLVLQPLALHRERKPGSYDYAVSVHDEEHEINPALNERLLRDFGLRLPAWEEDDELGDYLLRATEVVNSQPRWQLHRWVTISNFSFARIAMYQDLDAERWPSGQAPHAHATFRLLTSDRRREPITRWDDESEQLPELADELSSLILDADTSQVAAVLEAMEPRNLVIKGPPGTGKSQTIANLIAAALQTGQRVLFIAEKLAALEVVKARLDQAGLGAFCLELHSHRATRKAVMEALGQRLDLRERVPAKLDAQKQRARALRASLNEYASSLNAAHGSLGYTVHELIWRRERARWAVAAFAPTLEPLRVPGALAVRLEALDAVRHALLGLGQAAHDRDRVFAEDADSCWLALDRAELEEEPLLACVEAHQTQLLRICASVRRQLGPDAGAGLSVRQVQLLRTLTRELPTYAQLRGPLIERLDEEGATGLRAALALLRRRAVLLDEVASSCHAVPAAQAAWMDLEAATAALASEAPEATLAALHADASERARACERLAKTGARVAELLAFAGMTAAKERITLPTPGTPGKDAEEATALASSDADDPQCVLILRSALAELEGAPRELLHALRSAPATTDESALPPLYALLRESAALRSRRQACLERLEPGAHDQELRTRGADYALALERPWWLGWLFAAFWAGRRLYARVARKPARSSREMAEALLEATRMLDAVARFEAREDVQRLAAQTSAGLDTDFELLVQAGEWARRIRREHAGLHTASAALQKLALREDLAQVDTLLAEARRQDLNEFWELALRAQRAGQGVSTTLDGERQRALKTLHALEQLRRAGLADEVQRAQLPELLEQLAELTEVEAELAATSVLRERLGLHEDVRELNVEELASTLHAFDRAVEHGIPKPIVASLAGPDTRVALAKELSEPLAGEERERAALAAMGLDDEAWPALLGTLDQCASASDKALGTRGLLRAQLRYLRELARAKTTFAGPVVDAAARGLLPFDKLVEACEFLLYHELIERACEQAPALGQRNGRELESMRRQFQALDREILKLHAKEIAARLSQRPAPEGVAAGKKSEWSELALIKHELSKKQRHVPLRQLLRRAGGALRVLKPCFMMSPLTVAQYLPQVPDQFDLVIIDEASQMRPEEALGAIVRAKRVVVVGDPKQLPPTSFFQRLESGAEGDDEPDESRDEAIDQESILDLGVASFGASRDLRWHYRSRHPSLIAFSNQRFYDGRLKVFPTPVRGRSHSGVQLVRVDGAYSASLNRIEAEQIALGVAEHVRQNKGASLGVVAMNQKQKELIYQKIYELDDEAVRAFVDAQQVPQPFFVKSLENVQGDERDVIFVSMTYGPDPKTKRVLQRFGPLNSPYGARRLNVLFTRARERLVVYSSLRPADVRVEQGASEGLRTLRDYLVYAEHGELEADEAERPPLTPFEQTVREILEQAGYTVVPQIGVRGFFVDLAVQGPDSSSFACGIECDGARYHAQRSTRDRERLRQEVLESQGWKLVRVWSTDWYRAPDAARDRLLAAVRAHCRASAEPDQARASGAERRG